MKLYIDEFTKEITADVVKAYVNTIESKKVEVIICFADSTFRKYEYEDFQYKYCTEYVVVSALDEANMAIEYIRNGMIDHKDIMDFSYNHRFYRQENGSLCVKVLSDDN